MSSATSLLLADSDDAAIAEAVAQLEGWRLLVAPRDGLARLTGS